MKLIVGLGNPGKSYEQTRHNIGFMVIDELLKNPVMAEAGDHIVLKENNKFQATMAEINVKGEKILIVKPLTFMNASGEAVKKITEFYKINKKDVWVVADDIELPLGRIRVRLSGSSGGHNGLESIIDGFKADDFTRLRLGIGEIKTLNAHKEIEHLPHQLNYDTKDYVLGKFTAREIKIVNDVVQVAAKIIADSLNKCETLEAHTLDVF